MSQQEVIEILEKAKKPMSRGEIAITIKVKNNTDSTIENIGISVSHDLNKLVKFDEVKCIEISREQALKLYKCKRRMRLYYV